MKATLVLAASLVSLLAIGVLVGCGLDWDSIFHPGAPRQPAPQAGPRPTPSPQTVPVERPTAPGAAIKESIPVVILETSEGTITLELWADKAPQTVANFLQIRRRRLLRRHDLPPRD